MNSPIKNKPLVSDITSDLRLPMPYPLASYTKSGGPGGGKDPLLWIAIIILGLTLIVLLSRCTEG